jgi:acyl-coenzyme A thioesterase 13
MEQNLLEVYNSMNQFGTDHAMTYTVLEPGRIEYHFTPGQRHLATRTAVHGGMIAAYMDAIIGVAALSSVYTEGKLVATVEFKINFLVPAFAGIPLKGLGQVVSKGKSILVVKGDVLDTEGKIIATALGTLKAYLAIDEAKAQ